MAIEDDNLHTLASSLVEELFGPADPGASASQAAPTREVPLPLYVSGVDRLLRELRAQGCGEDLTSLGAVARQELASLKLSGRLETLVVGGLTDRQAPGAVYNISIGQAGTVVIGDGNSVYTAPPPSRPPLRQLSSPVADFVGRAGELARLEQALSEAADGAGSAVALIRGLGGCGKTELAYSAASRVASLFPGDQLFLDLGGAGGLTPEEALGKAIDALDLAGRPPAGSGLDVLRGRYLSALAGRRALIIADDARDKSQVEALIPPAGCGLLVTTRKRFSLPGRVAVDLGPLDEGESAALLRTICPRIGDHAPALARLCGNLALALRVSGELLANSTRGVERFLQQLEIERLKHLRDPEAGDNRRASVEASLRLSYEDLAWGAQAALQRLSVLQGRFARGAAEAAVDEVGEDLIETLHRRSLLEWDEGREQYHLHDLVRVFAAKRLDQPGPVHRRVAAHFEGEGGEPLRAARHYLAAGEVERAAAVATTRSRAIIGAGEARGLRELLELLERESLGAESRLSLEVVLGEIWALQGESRRARGHYRRALALLRGRGATEARALRRARIYRGIAEALEYEAPERALRRLRMGLAELAGVSTATDAARDEEALLRLRLGSLLTDLGAYDEASGELERSLELLKDGPLDLRAGAAMNLGIVRYVQGQADEGLALFAAARALYEQAGDRWALVSLSFNQARAQEEAGQWDEAAGTYEEASRLAAELGSVTRRPPIELGLGILYTNRGDHGRARAHLEESLRLAIEHELRHYLVNGHSSMADLLIRLGDWGGAEGHLREAEGLALELKIGYQLPEIYRGWAAVRLTRGDRDGALADAGRALDLARELGDPREEGLSLRALGEALAGAGHPGEAREALKQSLALLDGRDPYEAARTRAALGAALLATGDAAGAELQREARATLAGLGALAEEKYVSL